MDPPPPPRQKLEDIESWFSPPSLLTILRWGDNKIILRWEDSKTILRWGENKVYLNTLNMDNLAVFVMDVMNMNSSFRLLFWHIDVLYIMKMSSYLYCSYYHCSVVVWL